MSEATTLNVERVEAHRFRGLQLRHAAKLGRRVSQPEYLSHVVRVMEHLEGCESCRQTIRRHIKAEDGIDGE